MNAKTTTPTDQDSPRLTGPTVLVMAVVAALVMTATALLHCGVLHDVIMWDEADYAYAAHQGFIANALNLDNINFGPRHGHAPLSIYAIHLSTSLFGMDEWAVRLPAIAASVLSSGLAVLVGFSLASGSRKAKLVVGTICGALMATAPAAVLMTTVARPHAFVALFLLLNIWTLCRYLRQPTALNAAAFGLSLAGQFVSMEYGPIVVILSLVAIAIVQPRRLGLKRRWPYVKCSPLFPFIKLHRHVWMTLWSCLGGIAVVWPAGLYRLSVLLNFGFLVRYGQGGHRAFFRGEIYQHVPKYAYAWWYWDGYPLLLAGMVLSIVLIALWAWKERKPVAVTLAVFTFGLVAAVHGAHIMGLCYSLYMIPPLALGGPLAGQWVVRTVGAHCQRLLSRPNKLRVPWLVAPHAIAAALILIATLAVVGGRTTPATSNDQKNNKLIAVTQELGRMAEPGERVLAQAWPVVRFVLLKMGRDDVTVSPYNPSNYEEDNLQARFDADEFDWAVTAGSTTLAHKDCPLLAQLHEQWMVVSEQSQPPQEYRLYAPPTTRRAAGYRNKQRPPIQTTRSAGR